MARSLPAYVDTVIIGNGPSALILSYILHGNIPYYVGGHHDNILDAKLKASSNLLRLTPDLHAHFLSSLRYSTQALPVNTLLDTLIRPNADTELNPKSCVEWRHDPQKAISHVAIGKSTQAGGQWTEPTISASVEIGTLSYGEQLSLPGYSYADHLAQLGQDNEADFVRPSRTEYANYLKVYPEVVAISDAIHSGLNVDNVYRYHDEFMIGSLGVRCKHLVLASGTFSINIPPPAPLAPLTSLHSQHEPLLVIGSGFSAADIVISTPPTRSIIHVFHWRPEEKPSPLRGCHHTAYPEYAALYRQMKLAATGPSKNRSVKPLLGTRKSSPFDSRDWNLYKGLPNAEIVNVSLSKKVGLASVTIKFASGETITREVGGFAYAVGRRGTLNFLSSDLRSEVLSTTDQDTSALDDASALISGRTFRAKAESSLEVAKCVFIIGSLTGDSLIRHAVGGCVFAAGRIFNIMPSIYSPHSASSRTSSTPGSVSPVSNSPSNIGRANTESALSTPSRTRTGLSTPAEWTNGHDDLHLDRRELTRAVEAAHAKNKLWVGSGRWAGGLGPRGAGK